MATYHHEKWDGSGYPEGRSGEDIPLCARIMAVADVFDALAFKRYYKDALSLDATFDIIEESCGTHFDPVVADALCNVREKIEKMFESNDFESCIRNAVSLGGDSDTLACITGGIAEAFYKEIPRSMAERVARPFPGIFNKILDAVRVETVYGETCKIVD